jgi:hypothetical protein
MSSTIEFRHLAIALPSGPALDAVRAVVPSAEPFYDWGSDGNQYIVFAEAGSSNVFDHRNRVARRWHLAAVGTTYQVLRTVTHQAADTVLSGGTCLHTRSRWTRPETYIATYREALENAFDLDAACALFNGLRFKLNLPANPEYQHRWNAREEYRSHLRAISRLEGAEDRGALHTAPFGTTEGLADLAFLSTLGQDAMVPAWTIDDFAVDEALDRAADRLQARTRRKVRA